MLAALVAATLVAAAPTSDDRIAWMRVRLSAQSDALKARGIDATVYVGRLDDLLARYGSAGNNPAIADDLARQTALELQVDEALLAGSTPALGTTRSGAGIAFAALPGTAPDPVAIYVPPKPNARGEYGLVVILHGRGQTETDVVSHSAFRQLADRDHAILIAPWSGGTDTWGDPAITEILGLVGAVRAAFPIDPRHIYLAGISAGGAGAFHLATTHAQAFAAFMSIMGELPEQDAPAARQALRDRDVYAVFGDSDAIVTTQKQSFLFNQLASNCVPLSFYIAPHAEHDLYETFPVVEKAWADMFGGIVRNENTRECTPGT